MKRSFTTHNPRKYLQLSHSLFCHKRKWKFIREVRAELIDCDSEEYLIKIFYNDYKKGMFNLYPITAHDLLGLHGLC